MTEIDPPYTCPHCGKVLEFIRDHAGRTVHIRKGWRDVHERDLAVWERYQELLPTHGRKLICQKILAQEFCLSAKTIELIVYRKAKP